MEASDATAEDAGLSAVSVSVYNSDGSSGVGVVAYEAADTAEI